MDFGDDYTYSSAEFGGRRAPRMHLPVPKNALKACTRKPRTLKACIADVTRVKRYQTNNRKLRTIERKLTKASKMVASLGGGSRFDGDDSLTYDLVPMGGKAAKKTRTPKKATSSRKGKASRGRSGSKSRTPARSRKASTSGGCSRQTLKKYTSRPGPPYPANDPHCRGTTKTGNNGQLYVSKPDKNGLYTWKLVAKD